MRHSTNSGERLRNAHAEAPAIRLDQPGRLRKRHVLALLGVSLTTFHDRMNSGKYPKPDGYEGRMPYWKTDTVKAFLDL